MLLFPAKLFVKELSAVTYDFQIISWDDPRYVPPPKHLLSMSLECFGAICEWLTKAETGSVPNSELLFCELRYARIESASEGNDR